jgi:DNA-binding MarR family transcriptional regulator
VRLARLFERADAGLSLAQFRILELVSRGTERSTHIASRLATSKPAITAVVDGLVGAGLLERRPLPRDRRVIVLSLTPAGREALVQAERAYRDRLAPLLEEISDPTALLRALAELDHAMDARWTARAARHRPAPTTSEVHQRR